MRIWVDEQFLQNSGQIGVDVALEMLGGGGNHSFKVYFNLDKSVYNLIVGVHPEVNPIELKPHAAAYCKLRCTK